MALSTYGRMLRPGLLLIPLFLLSTSVRAADCNRECLQGWITRYLDAMVAHNPAALPLAANIRFTENSQEMRLGDGLWKNASRIRPYRQDILDVREGIAASQVVVEEGGSPVLLVLRLKVAAGKLSEAETMVTRTQKEGAIFNIDALKEPRTEMNLNPPRNQRASREEAIRLAEFYPAGLKIGSFVTVDAPFAADAYRLENGRITAGAGCARAGAASARPRDER